jgi:hypothetical protein
LAGLRLEFIASRAQILVIRYESQSANEDSLNLKSSPKPELQLELIEQLPARRRHAKSWLALMPR